MLTDLPQISAEQAMDAARLALPGLRPTRLLLPSRMTSHYVIYGKAGSTNLRRSSFVCVDAYSGRTLEIYDARQTDPRIRTVEAVDSPHLADFSSLSLKLLYIGFWLSIVALPLTGLLFLYSS